MNIRATSTVVLLFVALSLGCAQNQDAARSGLPDTSAAPAIALVGAQPLFETAIPDSLNLHLRLYHGSVVLSLERVISFDRDRRPIMIILDTLGFNDTIVSAFRRCSEVNMGTWIAVGNGSRIVVEHPSWTIVAGARLERNGLSGQHGCPEIVDEFED